MSDSLQAVAADLRSLADESSGCLASTKCRMVADRIERLDAEMRDSLERVEAGAGTAALRRVYEAARRYFRNEAESAVVCTNNLNRIRDAIEDVKLIDGGYEPAPPTDASGGIRELANIAENGARDIERWIAGVAADGSLAGAAAHKCRQVVFDAVIEAADRARKPVDASAQAASAVEPVLERDYRVGAGVIRAGCKVSTLIKCAERNQEYYLRDRRGYG